MSYLGSKAGDGSYQVIISLMPIHDTYIEPFYGTGAIMKNKPRAARHIAIDKNFETIKDYRSPDCDLFICADSVSYIEKIYYQGLGKVLIYADPPYPHETRSNKRYKFELTELDHVTLCNTLNRLAARFDIDVMLSTYANSLYPQLLKGWHLVEYQVMTRGGPRTEQLWTSFDYSVAPLVISDYAGSGFTDRQRIKRKALRWAKSFASMPAAERAVILSTMLQHSHKQL